MDSSFAESMNAQVLTIRTSASSAREVISMPRCNTLPSMISASTRFFAQPRLIMPTLVRCSARRAWRDSRLAPKAFGATAAGEFMNRLLVDRHVFVAVLQRLSILCDLDSIRIENANRDMLPVKFHGSICRRNPALKGRTAVFVANSHFHIGSLKWPDSDGILLA